jgi:hypothetical protein
MSNVHEFCPAPRRAGFTQANVSRAAKGAMAAGLNVIRVEIDAFGKIVVVCGDASASEDKAAVAFDQWKGRKHARAA